MNMVLCVRCNTIRPLYQVTTDDVCHTCLKELDKQVKEVDLNEQQTTEDILNERRKTHGDFKEASETHYKAKALFRPAMEKNGVPIHRIEAVEAIIAKINRIAHGNHDHEDHWDDIAGYAMLGKGKKEPESYRCDKCGQKKSVEEIEYTLVGVKFDYRQPNIITLCKECAEKKRQSENFKKEGIHHLFTCRNNLAPCNCEENNRWSERICKEIIERENSELKKAMEPVVSDNNFWCCGCEKEIHGKPKLSNVMMDGVKMHNCEDCANKYLLEMLKAGDKT